MTVSVTTFYNFRKVLICTVAQHVREPGRYLAKVFCSERLVYYHNRWLPTDHFQGVDYFSEAYCRVKDADTELLVKGMTPCIAIERERLTCGPAAECVSERGKELCADINGECVTEQDGYYYTSAICVIFGVIFIVGYIIPTARKLQGELLSSLTGILTDLVAALPVHRWRINVE
jgi:PAT family acetyl-CoA transporter-like MFS transporter 1